MRHNPRAAKPTLFSGHSVCLYRAAAGYSSAKWLRIVLRHNPRRPATFMSNLPVTDSPRALSGQRIRDDEPPPRPPIWWPLRQPQDTGPRFRGHIRGPGDRCPSEYTSDRPSGASSCSGPVHATRVTSVVGASGWPLAKRSAKLQSPLLTVTLESMPRSARIERSFPRRSRRSSDKPPRIRFS